MVGEARSDEGYDDLNDAFFRKAPHEPTNWSRRYKQNVELIRSGKIANVALVVQRLEVRASDKGLSAGEQRMLERARNILECEAFLGLPQGWEGEEPDDGGSGVREPRRPYPAGGAGPQALNLPQGPGDGTDHLDQR